MAEHPEQVSVVTFWQKLGAIFAGLLADKAHADLTITVRDGRVQHVTVNRNYLPGGLPPTPPR